MSIKRIELRFEAEIGGPDAKTIENLILSLNIIIDISILPD